MPLTVEDRSKLKIYAKKDGRYDVSWYDQAGKRHVASRGTLAAAKSFQAQKIAELQRHRETKFDLDDREMYSLARDLASSHGHTVLQAVQEWHRSKGSSKAMPLGEVIEKFKSSFVARQTGLLQLAAFCFRTIKS